MGRGGRFICVAMPFILTIASIIAFLVVGLTGITSHDLFVFRIDLSNLTINAGDLQDFLKDVGSHLAENATGQHLAVRSPIEWHEFSVLDDAKANAGSVENTLNDLANINITASELGLGAIYDFTLWDFCVTPQDGKKNCTKAQFDWASHQLNTSWVEKLGSEAGFNVTIPKDINDGLNLYKTITKWTEVVFIIALIALVLELITGLFSLGSRGVSCLTWFISGLATTAVVATAVLLTVTGSIVIGVIEAAAHKFDIKTSLNTTFLAVLWLSAGLAIFGGFMWLLSACCCKPESRSNKRSSLGDKEKLIPGGSYAPLGEHSTYAPLEHNPSQGYNGGYNAYGFGGPQRGGARSDLAYEPYSHSHV
ncbi:SUR7 protein [Xylaria sp. CBS 124048]|nr:SUR7 protein [Xylaria sp. CBS 124048]